MSKRASHAMYSCLMVPSSSQIPIGNRCSVRHMIPSIPNIHHRVQDPIIDPIIDHRSQLHNSGSATNLSFPLLTNLTGTLCP